MFSGIPIPVRKLKLLFARSLINKSGKIFTIGSTTGIEEPTAERTFLIKGKGISEEKRGTRIANWARTSVSKTTFAKEVEGKVAIDGWERRPSGLKEKEILSWAFL